MCSFKPPKAFCSNGLDSVGKASNSPEGLQLEGEEGFPSCGHLHGYYVSTGSTSALEQMTLVFRVYRLGPFHITSMVCLLLRGCCIFFSICSNRAPEQASVSISRDRTSVEFKDTCGFQHSPPDRVLLILLLLRCFYSLPASWHVSTAVI